MKQPPQNVTCYCCILWEVYCVNGIFTMNQLSCLRGVIDFEGLAIVFLWGPAAEA